MPGGVTGTQAVSVYGLLRRLLVLGVAHGDAVREEQWPTATRGCTPLSPSRNDADGHDGAVRVVGVLVVEQRRLVVALRQPCARGVLEQRVLALWLGALIAWPSTVSPLLDVVDLLAAGVEGGGCGRLPRPRPACAPLTRSTTLCRSAAACSLYQVRRNGFRTPVAYTSHSSVLGFMRTILPFNLLGFCTRNAPRYSGGSLHGLLPI
jgi:hypothetical protein